MPHQRLEQEPSAGEASSDESEGARRAREARHNLAEISRLDAEAKVRAGGSPEGQDPLLLRAERHRKSGSYHELDQALTMMERTGGLAAWAAWVCEQAYAQGLPVDVDQAHQLRALDELSSWLPVELRVPNNPPSDTELKQLRDQRIVEARLMGDSPQVIALREQVSLATVYRVVGRPDGEAA